MEHGITDLTLGIKRQERAVLQMLSDREPDFADFIDGRYDVEFQTRGWYNGRERGICISMSRLCSEERVSINLAVFEHRNSDELCIVEFETKNSFFGMNPYTYEDAMKAGAYDTKNDLTKVFKDGEIGKCCDWIYDRLEEFYKARLAKKAA